MKDIRILNQFKEGNKMYIIAKSINEGCKCPKCGVVSYTKHSIYTRKLFNGSLNGISKEVTFLLKNINVKSKNAVKKYLLKGYHLLAHTLDSLLIPLSL